MQDMGELRIVRHTDRFDECCRFYGDVLGWPITKEWDDPTPGRIYGFGDSARVELLTAEPGTVEPTTGVFIAVEVDDVVAVHETVVSAGVAVTAALAVQPWGHRNFTIVDPAGMSVVFFEVLL